MLKKRGETPPQEKTGGIGRPNTIERMKNSSNILFVAVMAAMFLANRVNAQYQAVAEDGTAASPKVRQMLNERKAVSSTSSATGSSVQTVSEDRIIASPRARQMLNETRVVASTPSMSTTLAGYQAVGKDGAAASPKVRQQ